MDTTQTITITNISNQEFLQKYAAPGRVGLAGGATLINKAIGRAQRHVDAERNWSRWGHAFLLQGHRQDKRHWVFESDLEIHRRHIRLGVQENRLEKYHDESQYAALAVLDFGLKPDQVDSLLSSALDLVAKRTRYSILELFGTLLALRHPTLRNRKNVLAQEQSYYCSAFVHHLFRASGVDLAPGLELKHTTPEDLWRSLAPHTAYVLERPEKEAANDAKTKVIQSIKKLRTRRRNLTRKTS